MYLLSKQYLSGPLKYTTRVAKANPKSLIPNGLNPIDKVIPKRCNPNNKEEKQVYNPEIIKNPRVISKRAFNMTKLLAVIKEGITNSGTNETQASGFIVCENPK